MFIAVIEGDVILNFAGVSYSTVSDTVTQMLVLVMFNISSQLLFSMKPKR
jgi:hypothetical protein